MTTRILRGRPRLPVPHRGITELDVIPQTASAVAAIVSKLGLFPEPAHHRRVLAALTHLQTKDLDPNS